MNSRKKKTQYTPAAETTLVAYKGFDQNLSCRRFQYEVGKTYEHAGKVVACEGGFHACEHPLNVFSYYPPATSRYAEVSLSGAVSRHDEDTKIAAAKITINVELSLGELTKRAIDWVFARAKQADGPIATNQNEAATASGDQGAATASGDQGAATASGRWGAATASGRWGAATASGYQGAATASGRWGAATASGYQGAATASGYQGAATNTGWRGLAKAEGEHSAAISIGGDGRAAAAEGCLLVLVNRDPETGAIRHAWHGIAGRGGIKPNTIYTLSDEGAPVEVEE